MLGNSSTHRPVTLFVTYMSIRIHFSAGHIKDLPKLCSLLLSGMRRSGTDSSALYPVYLTH